MGLGVFGRTEERKTKGRRKRISEILMVMESQLCLIEKSFASRYSSLVQEALDELPESFTITDPCISGHPIVFASRGFLKMSGYSKEEVIGKNGRMFQGPMTDRRSVMEVREAIREERSIQIMLLNYRKDGTPFWMLFHLSPVFGNEDGRVIHFVAVQTPVSRILRKIIGNDNRLVENRSRFQEIVFGSCRKEICSDSFVEFGCVPAMGGTVVDSDNKGLDAEESCEACELEKQRTATVIENILSLLSHYSELSRKRSCYSKMRPLGSAITISLGRIQQSFVLCDPHLPDMPIVYASDAFLSLTGYARDEILGQNCRFIQGSDTDEKTICEIRESIQSKQACSVRILNYRKNGSSFWNFLHISPVRNATGKIAFYVGVQIEEDCKNEDSHGLSPEMRHRGVVGAVRVAIRTLSIGAGPSE
ncbi:hypothetical protein Sjap_023803 [Stephania japonica]|uniref:LOV domain-containing protein n=1 Tax=Stephania japonica TaxID=461633 RepID=A0AAP0EC95_9MAGN